MGSAGSREPLVQFFQIWLEEVDVPVVCETSQLGVHSHGDACFFATLQHATNEVRRRRPFVVILNTDFRRLIGGQKHLKARSACSPLWLIRPPWFFIHSQDVLVAADDPGLDGGGSLRVYGQMRLAHARQQLGQMRPSIVVTRR